MVPAGRSTATLRRRRAVPEGPAGGWWAFDSTAAGWWIDSSGERFVEDEAETSRKTSPEHRVDPSHVVLHFFFPFFFLCVTECFFLFLNVSCATARGFTQFLTFFFFFFRKQLSFPTEFVDVLNFVTFLRILVLISSKIWLSLVSTLYYS